MVQSVFTIQTKRILIRENLTVQDCCHIYFQIFITSYKRVCVRCRFSAQYRVYSNSRPWRRPWNEPIAQTMDWRQQFSLIMLTQLCSLHRAFWRDQCGKLYYCLVITRGRDSSNIRLSIFLNGSINGKQPSIIRNFYDMFLSLSFFDQYWDISINYEDCNTYMTFKDFNNDLHISLEHVQ